LGPWEPPGGHHRGVGASIAAQEEVRATPQFTSTERWLTWVRGLAITTACDGVRLQKLVAVASGVSVLVDVTMQSRMHPS